jgi:hypothetical protein
VFRKEYRTTCRVLVWKPIRKRLLGSPRHKWENKMMNHNEVCWQGVDWIYLHENREDGGHCERGSEPLHFVIRRGVFMTIWGIVSFSRRTLLHIISVLCITLHGVSLFCGSITLCSLNFEVKTVAVNSMLHILSIVAFKGNNIWTVQLVRWSCNHLIMFGVSFAPLCSNRTLYH